MSSFVDEREKGALYLSHISLLFGCASPLWVAPLWGGGGLSVVRGGGEVEREDLFSALPIFAGVLSLGIGDSMVCYLFFVVGRELPFSYSISPLLLPSPSLRPPLLEVN